MPRPPPTATLKSTVSGAASNRVPLEARSGEKVKADGSERPAGQWPAGICGSC
ncbi:hypothetical protein ABT215_01340 [Streptomyces sp900105755]|uniref:hypothetical protein n=1 Tax=Streptomyces sp. 900105755 TaxID=3154389 RepID=UPI003331DCD2